MDISERDFEATIERALLSGGPDSAAESGLVRDARAAYGAYPSGGYRKRSPDDYDRALCLIPRDVLDFVYATQPKEWEKFAAQHGADAKPRLLQRLHAEVAARGTLDVLRDGIKAHGCTFRLAYFPPSSGLNPDLQTLYAANQFAAVRQLHYSERDEKSLDLALFLNGLPIFTAELKNRFTGQSVEEAIRQYQRDRDPREPLFAFGRCLAHFALDSELVYMTTQLEGLKTRFLPFNQGRNGGAGNPDVSITRGGYATAYLWERIWAPASVLNLVQHFIQVVEDEDETGRRTGKRRLLFPRYHQLDAVRRLVVDARDTGTGRRYLIQHSAGSGKSNSIAWLAHQLAILHDAADQRVFDSVIVITDRRILDRQLQRTVRQFEQTLGTVENIDQTSRQLKEALQHGKHIIVTTLQKFPQIVRDINALPGQRFAVIIDEAHSSQSGESTKSLKLVLTAGSLEEAEEEDRDFGEDLEDRIADEMRKRGPVPNVSFFAFTATPKPRTLELFGSKRDDGTYRAFSVYSMRQAIEEGFILDVLENYTTYRTYWSLFKKIADDPRYDRAKAEYLLRSYVDLHPHAVEKKVAIMADHCLEHTVKEVGGRAKAMIVTRSRLHAVRYKQAVDKYLAARGWPFRALVAFSGTVRDEGVDFTEAGMNGFPETQTAEQFKRDEYRLLIAANKFQTGFDQPLLHTMYVDKKLGGVNAVQTLSRLNRVYPSKTSTLVLDFANIADEIRKAFEPYYETTLLSEGTDPNLLYDLQTRLRGFRFYTEGEVQQFAAIYFDPKATQDRLHAALAAVVGRYQDATPEEQTDFRGQLNDYVRLYAFLSQVLTFVDADLEKLYVFARLLLRKLPIRFDHLPVEVQRNIDVESYRIQETSQGKITLARGGAALDPQASAKAYRPYEDELEALSQIIRELNQRFGTDFTDDDRVCIREIEERLAASEALEASIRANSPENARLTFDHVVGDLMQDMIDGHFKFYKQVNDSRPFAKAFFDWLFERYVQRAKAPAAVQAPDP
ncbi:MAG TPA: type I restriction endonuclease [Ktedonobacterales bacterium]|nr:type I restriction endonuclease [Ktedonobacterales bacterium]